ncbi:MAG: transglutaminase domain-containing protein, partial [Dactylosporangium sp.]|nr:transglutaminase-like domain-containing protein [Dactylosporangium sp.]NNJ61234.1 transglutaminase domain-containing protein [Dactylosporangium sp.]
MHLRRTIDTALVTLTTMVALAGFATVYAGWTWLVFGIVGVGLAIGAGFLAERFALPAVAAVALGMVGLIVLAGPVVLPQTTVGRVVPTAATLRALVDGAVGGWREIVTIAPPIAAEGHLAVAPYLCGFATALAGFLLATRTRIALAPILAPAGLLVGGILLGTAEPAALWLQGSGFAVLALGWVAVRQRWRAGAALPVRLSGLLTAVGMLLVAAGAGYGAVLVVPVGDQERYVLREHVDRPFDPRQYPSPLAGFRRYEVALKSKVLFTVAGLPAGARIQLAAMDTYDGAVWGVAGNGITTASGMFERVGERVPTNRQGRAARVTITVKDLDGVWVPMVGNLRELRFSGDRAMDLTASFRYNRETGSAVVPARLRAGDRLNTSVVVPVVPETGMLTGQAVVDTELPRPIGVPESVAATATEWTAGAGTPVAQMRALVDKLRQGAFSDGTADSGVRSRPGHGAGRLREFLAADQLVGDAEQYAATLGLLARALGIPARVVLGVAPTDGFTGDVTGSMVTAWVEVPVDGAGWVAFDPTPPVTNRPQPPQPENQPNGTTEVVAPPVIVVQPPAQLPPPDSVRDPKAGAADGTRSGWVWRLLRIAATIALPLLPIAAALAAVVGWKARRRRGRRGRGTTSHRLALGWTEALDRLRDLGVAV